MTKRLLTLVLTALISCISLPTLAVREHAARFLEEILPLEKTAYGIRGHLVEGWQAHTPVNAGYLVGLGPEDNLDIDRVQYCIRRGVEKDEFIPSNPLALACALADLSRVKAMLANLPNEENLNDEKYWTQGFRQSYTLVEATLSAKFGWRSNEGTYMVGDLEDRIQILGLLHERGVPFVGSESKWHRRGIGYYNNPPIYSLHADSILLLPPHEIEALYMESVRLGADVTEWGSSYHVGKYCIFRHDDVLLANYRRWHHTQKAGWLHESTKRLIRAKMLDEIAQLQALSAELDPTTLASTS